MSMLLGTWRSLLNHAGAAAWTPAMPTSDGGVLPAHWYRSDGPLWQDAGVTPAVADGDVVGRWEDLTANADHVNQAVVANKPTLQSGAGDLLNGHPVIRADGIDDYLRGAFTTGGALAQPYIIFAVAALDAAQVNDNMFHILLTGDDAANYAHLLQDTALNPDNWAILAAAWLRGGDSDANWNIWTTLFNGVTSRFWHNGIAECAAGNAGANGIDGLTIAANQNVPPNSAFGKFDYAEIIIYGSNLSDADKNQVGQYLATRYALAYTDI